MTTPQAESAYLAAHQSEHAERKPVVFNPKNRKPEDLPAIFAFNNGGAPGLYHAVALSEDGKVLGGHGCSSEGYIPHDLGVLEGTRPDRHETYREHYPDGYRMVFVSTAEMDHHMAWRRAVDLCNDSAS